MDKKTKIFLNTWGAYNDGCLGYGWFTPPQARKFIDNNPDIDGGEFFIADIENYTGFTFSNLDYCNVNEVIDTIEQLEELDLYERDCVVALMENDLYLNVAQAIEELDNNIFYANKEEYHNFLDEIVNEEIEKYDGLLSMYFDYEAYYRTEDFNIFEASNGVCLLKNNR